MSGGANKRREVLKFEGDDINEYMDVTPGIRPYARVTLRRRARARAAGRVGLGGAGRRSYAPRSPRVPAALKCILMVQ